MCNKYRPLTEVEEPWKYYIYSRCIFDHCIRYGCKFFYLKRNRFFRIDELREPSNLFTFRIDSDRTYLYDLAVSRRKTCGLNIENHIFRIKGTAPVTVYTERLKVIYKISLETVNYLKVFVLISMKCNRECLYNSVISYSHCSMSEGLCTFNSISYVRNAVHFRIHGMKMKFYSLLRSIILPLLPEIRYRFDSIYTCESEFL